MASRFMIEARPEKIKDPILAISDRKDRVRILALPNELYSKALEELRLRQERVLPMEYYKGSAGGGGGRK
jgi:hypothetical protein